MIQKPASKVESHFSGAVFRLPFLTDPAPGNRSCPDTAQAHIPSHQTGPLVFREGLKLSYILFASFKIPVGVSFGRTSL